MPNIIAIDEALDEYMDVNPQRVTLVRSPGLDTETVFPVLFNPETLNEEISVQWSKLQVIGLDHEVPHYTNTRSLSYNLEFYWSEFQYYLRQRTQPRPPTNNTLNSVPTKPQDAQAFMNFLRSCAFPTRTGLRPPTLKVIWPGMFELLGVVERITFAFTRFDTNLAPIVYRATVGFLETRVTRRFSEDVDQVGLTYDGYSATGQG